MKTNRNRWRVVAIFFVFMLLHQADKLLIGPLTTPIMETFKINEAQMGFVFSGAVIVGALFYPLWGYLYDRYGRAKLLALAAFIWGSTTWISAVAVTYPTFLFSRASTGIDDSSYPGIYSLISDYFPPRMRGKIYGLLETTSPLGYLIGTVLALTLGGHMVGAIPGWRFVFYITGSLGILVAILIYFGVKDAPRGGSEPEFEGKEQIGTYHFEWKIALQLFKKRSFLLLLAQGFFGVFPWQVITFWFFRYLQAERGYGDNDVLVTMVFAVLVLAIGYPLGGALGDWLFKKTPRGRLIVSTIGVILGAILLWFTLNIPLENKINFTIMLCLTSIFIPFAASNVLSTVYDITLPEVRSTANALQSFVEQGGSAVAPTLAGLIAVASSLKNAILIICVGAWIICFVFFIFATILVPKDIEDLRSQLRERAALEAQSVN